MSPNRALGAAIAMSKAPTPRVSFLTLLLVWLSILRRRALIRRPVASNTLVCFWPFRFAVYAPLICCCEGQRPSVTL